MVSAITLVTARHYGGVAGHAGSTIPRVPSTQTLLVFLLVSAAFVAVPGPSNLFVLGRGLQSGARAGVAGATGCATGALTYVIATAAGLSALIASSQTVFAAIHYAGAAYLCWLGVSALRAAHDALAQDAVAGPMAIWPAYRNGVIVELGNPKVALFFLALFPQFVHRAAGAAWMQIIVLGAIFVTIGLASDCAYAVGSGRIREWLLRRPGRVPRQQRMTGVLYIGLGLWAALAGADRGAPAAPARP
jgi:threonine/homoserine/homoserine lactone efflux protein